VDVRSNVSGYEAFATFKDGTAEADGGPKVIAGLPVAVTATATNVLAADFVTVGGKALVTGTPVTLNLTTDAAGQVKVLVASTAADAADSIVFNFAAQGKTTAAANVNADFDGGTVTAAWAASTYSIIDTAAVNGSATRTIAPKGSYTVDYKLFDQWGDAPADNTYRLSIALTGDDRTDAAAWAYYPVVVGGKVSQVIADKLAGTDGAIAVAVAIQTYPAGAVYTAGATVNANHTLVIATDAAVNAVTLGNATAAADTTVEVKNVLPAAAQVTNYTSSNKNYRLSQKDFANYDGRTSTATAPDVETAIALEISGFAQGGSFATGIAGVPVTISGEGLQFRAVVRGDTPAGTVATDVKNVWATNSLTLLSEVDGEFGFHVWSHKAGSQTVTITSGAVSKTVTLSFAALVAEAAKAIVLDAPATVLPGRTVEFVALVVDKWGNGVSGLTYTFTQTGVGYLNAATATSGADGKGSVRLLLGTNEVGTATVTAKFTHTDTLVYSSAAKTVTVGAAVPAASTKAGAVIASKNGRVYVTVNNAAGFLSSVKVGFSTKPSVRAASASQLVSYFVGAGKRVAVVVSVRGGIVASQAITIK
jgi:hypothetical protein